MTTVFTVCLFFGFTSLYATLVCVACSQVEKLRAALLDIRQIHGISEQNCGDAGDQRALTYDEQFRRMQKQLNNCIRHHQQIKRCGHNE